MLTSTTPLSTNGLIMPPDFPVAHYEAVYKTVGPRAQASKGMFEQFAGAWNALAYRYFAVTQYEAAFTASIANMGTSPEPFDRYEQERDLFCFFSNSFSVLEASFYGLFSIGAVLSPANFPLVTERDQQKVSPSFTAKAMARTFPSDPLCGVITSVLTASEYLELREVRNVLTHRVAPGRTFFVGIGGTDPLPDHWNIKSISLDSTTAPARRAALSKLISDLLKGTDQFAKSHF